MNDNISEIHNMMHSLKSITREHNTSLDNMSKTIDGITRETNIHLQNKNVIQKQEFKIKELEHRMTILEMEMEELKKQLLIKTPYLHTIHNIPTYN